MPWYHYLFAANHNGELITVNYTVEAESIDHANKQVLNDPNLRLYQLVGCEEVDPPNTRDSFEEIEFGSHIGIDELYFLTSSVVNAFQVKSEKLIWKNAYQIEHGFFYTFQTEIGSAFGLYHEDFILPDISTIERIVSNIKEVGFAVKALIPLKDQSSAGILSVANKFNFQVPDENYVWLPEDQANRPFGPITYHKPGSYNEFYNDRFMLVQLEDCKLEDKKFIT